MFQRATKKNITLRMALQGPSGSGKTRTALEVAKNLVPNGHVALIDTEKESSCRYSHLYEFDMVDLQDHHPNKYIEAIRAANGYDVLIIDSLSHAWFWELNTVNAFTDWSKVRPLERALVDEMLNFRGHLIVTMRSKTEWLVEEGENKKGKKTNIPTKVGTAPIQSSGIEYEFDVCGEMDLGHILHITKTRLDSLDGKEYALPGAEFASEAIAALMEGGEPEPPFDRNGLLEQVSENLTVLDWDAARGGAYLQEHFGKRSRAKLTNSELTEFNTQLHQLVDEQRATALHPV
ncbi:MAG: AAA family ATPase [Cyanobacteria bacterium J06627_8]